MPCWSLQLVLGLGNGLQVEAVLALEIALKELFVRITALDVVRVRMLILRLAVIFNGLFGPTVAFTDVLGIDHIHDLALEEGLNFLSDSRLLHHAPGDALGLPPLFEGHGEINLSGGVLDIVCDNVLALDFLVVIDLLHERHLRGSQLIQLLSRWIFLSRYITAQAGQAPLVKVLILRIHGVLKRHPRTELSVVFRHDFAW